MRASAIIKRLLIAVAGVIVIAFLLLAFSYWRGSYGVFGATSFEKDTWIAKTTNEKDATCYRGGMAKDIQNNLLTNNMTKEDVVNLLGEPDGNSSDTEYQYVLGMCSGYGWDYDNLHIYFNSQGRFKNAKIIQH